MGSSHSSDPEGETATRSVEGNDDGWNERMISEIDSDADLDPASVPSMDVRNYGHDEDQQQEQQDEDEQGRSREELLPAVWQDGTASLSNTIS